MKIKNYFKSAVITMLVLSLITPVQTVQAKTIMPFKGERVFTSSDGVGTLTLKSNGRFAYQYYEPEGDSFYLDVREGSFSSVKKSGNKYTMKYKPIKGYKGHTKNYKYKGISYYESYYNAHYKTSQKFILYSKGYKVKDLPKRIRTAAKETCPSALISSDNSTLEKTNGYILDGGDKTDVFFENVQRVKGRKVKKHKTSGKKVTKNKATDKIKDGTYCTVISCCQKFKKEGNSLAISLDHNEYFRQGELEGKKTKYKNIKIKLSKDCKWYISGVDFVKQKGSYEKYSYTGIQNDIKDSRKNEWDAGLVIIVKKGMIVNVIICYS